jgi:hypothetical protein
VIDADPERDAPQPDAEPGRVREQVEVPERAEECLLNHVVAVGRLPNERQYERVHHSVVARYESRERPVRGAAVARVPGGDDELGVGGLRER